MQTIFQVNSYLNLNTNTDSFCQNMYLIHSVNHLTTKKVHLFPFLIIRKKNY